MIDKFKQIDSEAQMSVLDEIMKMLEGKEAEGMMKKKSAPAAVKIEIESVSPVEGSKLKEAFEEEAEGDEMEPDSQEEAYRTFYGDRATSKMDPMDILKMLRK